MEQEQKYREPPPQSGWSQPTTYLILADSMSLKFASKEQVKWGLFNLKVLKDVIIIDLSYTKLFMLIGNFDKIAQNSNMQTQSFN